MLAQTNRWQRADRYLRWRQRRFAPLRLPEDVLVHLLLHHLDAEHMLRTVEALWGPLRHDREEDVRRLPSGLRAAWTLHRVRRNFCIGLLAYQSRCYHAASHCHHVAVYVDWSPFASPVPPEPVARFAWLHVERPTMMVDEAVLLRCIGESHRRQRPFGYVTAYECHWFPGGARWQSCVPFLQTVLPLMPVLSPAPRRRGESRQKSKARARDSYRPEVAI